MRSATRASPSRGMQTVAAFSRQEGKSAYTEAAEIAHASHSPARQAGWRSNVSNRRDRLHDGITIALDARAIKSYRFREITKFSYDSSIESPQLSTLQFMHITFILNNMQKRHTDTTGRPNDQTIIFGHTRNGK